MLKFADNPPMLAPAAASIAELPGSWWVAHTKARFEKALAQDLLKRNIGYYLPMVERVRFSGGRKRRVLSPLFTSYLFFCGDAQARHAALATDRISQVLAVRDRDQFVRELESIRRALNFAGTVDFYPFAAVGRRCRVVSGPLAGVVGTVIERNHQRRLVLSVSMLGQGASLEIDADLLEAAE